MLRPTARALGALSLFTVLACSPPQEAEGSRAAEAAPSFDLSYEKYTLENGLEVILHQDASDPAIAINIAAHVGSSRELPGRTGFAHLFEHLLFLDSENLGYGGLDDLNTRIGGGGVNGFTTRDMTQYYQTAPADALEKLVWAEAEKLGFFINTVTEDVLANERQVVKNEKRQGVDNQPYGFFRTIYPAALYPEDHPYSWSVIGSLEDLDAATLEDVKTFYRRWYVPNNVTLTIAGDFDADEAKAYVEKYFGEIPRGEEITPAVPRPAALTESIRLTHEDRFATLPRLYLVWPTVDLTHEDSAALGILTTYLSEGKEAPLNEVLIDEQQLTSSLGLYSQADELAGEIILVTTGQEGGELDALYAGVEEGLARFEAEGIAERDLRRIKAELEVSFYEDVESVLGKAITLAEANTLAGDPDYPAARLETLLSLTPDDITRVYETYIKDQPSLAIGFVPMGQTELALSAAETAEVVEEEIVAGEGAPVDFDPTARTFEPTPSSFDRSVEPPYGEAHDLPTPAIWRTELGNGLALSGIETGEIPLVAFSIRFDAGRMKGDAQKAGVPALTADLITKGTAERTVAELEEALQLLGAEIAVFVDPDGATLQGRSLVRTFPETIGIVTEILTTPRWDETEFDLLKQRVAQELALARGNPNAIADRVSAGLFYGEDHVLYYPAYGTEEQLDAITLEDLKAFWAANYRPLGGAFHVTGDISEPELIASLAGLEEAWTGSAEESQPLPPAAPVLESAVYFYDIPGAKQSVIEAQRPSLAATDPAFPLATAMNYFLGVTFTSDLMDTLRTQKGYTYGARSRFNGGVDRGTFRVYTSVRTNVTFESLELIRDILAAYGPSFDEARLAEMKVALLKRQALETETLGAKLGILEDISTYGYPDDYRAQNAAELEALDLDGFRQLTETYLRPDALNYVVVGDAESQASRLSPLGFGEPVMVPAFE